MISLYGISSVTISSHTINFLKKIKNPQIHLNPEDQNFIENEIRKADENLKSLQEESNKYLIKQNEIKSFIVKAKKISDRFNKMDIGVQDRFPQSIHFVADTRYRNLYSIYKEITTRRGGINDNIIYQMEQIEKIGVIKINEIYEYWCLISIIKVLVAKLKFSIKDNNWIHKLIDIILSKGKNQHVFFKFEHEYEEYMPIRINLHYQKELKSKKRPDFILQLKGEKKNDAKYLVMDAKFRGNISNEQIEKDIENLFETKNYSIGGQYPVFILHTSKTAMYDNSKKLISFSPLSWGRFCSYGGEKDFNHIKGHILLIPLSPSLENLQRLIGCFLQQNSYLRSDEEFLIDRFIENNSRWLLDLDDARSNRSFQKMNSYLKRLLPNYNFLQHDLMKIAEESQIIEHRNIICISCGSHNIRKKLKFTKAGREKYILTCNDCGLRSINTSCYKCSRKKLYKNGLWWTYHITTALQVSNIVCPSCGAYLLNTYDDSDYLENNDFV